jgi:hypothetical protein
MIISILILCSCSRKQSNKKTDTPVSLQNKKSYSLVSKRGPGDLVENLYSELVSETPALKELEEQIDDLDDRKDDSLSDYKKFTNKNENYYTSAGHHFEAINDSILKEKIKAVINTSKNNYNNSTAGLKTLIDQLNDKENSLKDYHLILKLIKTLPLIEEFQKDHLPSKKPINAVIDDYSQLIQKTESISKK